MDIRYIWTHTCPKNNTEQREDAIASELLRNFEKKWAEFPRSENWTRYLKKALAGKVGEKMPKVWVELLPEEKTEE